MRISVLGPVVRTTLVISLSCFSFVDASAQSSSPVAPTQIPVAGRLPALDGQPRTGAVDLVISLYDTQSDANPRWIEQQLGVPLDAGGGYSIQFGATMPDGRAGDLFATDGGARWLGVAVQGEAEQPRVMLLSVPYAARAASAETLGGKNASDFVLAASFRDDVRSALEESGVDDDVTTLGTNGFVAKFDAMGAPTADSVMFDDGTGIGIGTTTPASLFHMRGNLNTPAFRLENTEPGGATWQVTSANDGQLRFTEVGAAARMVINRTTGTVGIGTQAPQALMHLRAGLILPAFRLENTEAAGAAWQVTSANDGQFRLTEVGAAARLVVNKATGNVGIGVGAPAAKLHVGGNVTVDGALAGPTITSLQSELAALTARLAKLEGTE